MRTIEWTGQFKKDFKRESKGPHRKVLVADFFALVERLARDEVLEQRYRDHALTGEWRDFRDCHVRPDLVLIYMKDGVETLRLVRLGSHAELGL